LAGFEVSNLKEAMIKAAAAAPDEASIETAESRANTLMLNTKSPEILNI
jgi:hypothetical protein